MRAGYIALSAFTLILGACASAPTVTDPSGVDLTLKVLPETVVAARFGDAYSQADPFLVPGSVLTGNPNEFVVIEVTMVAARASKASLAAMSAKTADGTTVARYISRDEFAKYTDDWKEDDRSGRLKAVSIGRFYIPQDDFPVGPGRNTFIAVLIGKKPLVRPLAIVATFLVNESAKEYSIELP